MNSGWTCTDDMSLSNSTGPYWWHAANFPRAAHEGRDYRVHGDQVKMSDLGQPVSNATWASSDFFMSSGLSDEYSIATRSMVAMQ